MDNVPVNVDVLATVNDVVDSVAPPSFRSRVAVTMPTSSLAPTTTWTSAPDRALPGVRAIDVIAGGAWSAETRTSSTYHSSLVSLHSTRRRKRNAECSIELGSAADCAANVVWSLPSEVTVSSVVQCPVLVSPSAINVSPLSTPRCWLSSCSSTLLAPLRSIGAERISSSSAMPAPAASRFNAVAPEGGFTPPEFASAPWIHDHFIASSVAPGKSSASAPTIADG
jgi:hypothetical protein